MSRRKRPAAAASGVKETAVVRACLEYLRGRGHFVFRVNGGGFKTQGGGFVRCTDMTGVADIIGITADGYALAVECKREVGGRLSPAQEIFMVEWRNRQGVYVVARGIDDLRKENL